MNYLLFVDNCVLVFDDPLVFNHALSYYDSVKFYRHFDNLFTDFDSSVSSAIILTDYYYDKFINSDLTFSLFYVNDYSDFLDFFNAD